MRALLTVIIPFFRQKCNCSALFFSSPERACKRHPRQTADTAQIRGGNKVSEMGEGRWRLLALLFILWHNKLKSSFFLLHHEEHSRKNIPELGPDYGHAATGFGFFRRQRR
jgi:hypothetical protein